MVMPIHYETRYKMDLTITAIRFDSLKDVSDFIQAINRTEGKRLGFELVARTVSGEPEGKAFIVTQSLSNK
jgi:hypothetical protein